LWWRYYIRGVFLAFRRVGKFRKVPKVKRIGKFRRVSGGGC